MNASTCSPQKMVWWELLAILVGVVLIVVVGALFYFKVYKKQKATNADQEIVYGQLNPTD